MKDIFLVTIREGKLNLGSEHNRARFADFVKHNEGKRLRIEKLQSKRSLSQNNFYWAYLTLIAAETGDNETDLHEFFKRQFLPPRFVTVMKKEVKLPSSTTTLNKAEFSEYMEKICAMTGVPIPDPRQLKDFITNY